MHQNSQLLFSKYLKHLFEPNMRVLEVGPDSKNPYYFKDIVGLSSIKWETVDMTRSFQNLTYVAEDGYKFPVADNRYDLVFSASVIEHVPKIWVWIKELARVCKEGGKVLTIAPVSWPYHAVPLDCWRIYPDGMKALYEDAGLTVEINKVESLEKAMGRRGYPGRSSEIDGALIDRIKYRVKRVLKWPLPYAIDTITIGSKPAHVKN